MTGSPTASPASSPSIPLIAPLSGEPTVTLDLPYITKTLGGPDGWETPFIVQNADVVPTDIELNFYAIGDGTLVARRIVHGLNPGTSYADRPNRDPDLANDAAFSLVIRSFGAKVVAVVNVQRGSGSNFEADTYVSEIGGAHSIFLPSVTRRVAGFVTRIVVQNIDPEPTTATAAFVSLDGRRTATLTRTIQPGRSSLIEIGAEPDLVDGTEYAVRIGASGRLVAIANTERSTPADGPPMLYTYGAIVDGANMVFGPHAAKNVKDAGNANTRITVQNMGAEAAHPTLSLTPLGGGVTTKVDGPALASGASWAYDLRFKNGESRQGPCGSGTSVGCLADSEYSWTVASPGAQIAAIATTISSATAASYAALSRARDFFLPNVTRTLGGRDGWTTPIIVQSVTASRLTLSWFRFSDGLLSARQDLSIVPGTARRIDPRDVAALTDDTQYSVVIEGNGGRLVAIVVELNFQGGDGAAIYTGFFR